MKGDGGLPGEFIGRIRGESIEGMEKQGYKYEGVIVLDGVRYDWLSWPDNPDDDIVRPINYKRLKQEALKGMKEG